MTQPTGGGDFVFNISVSGIEGLKQVANTVSAVSKSVGKSTKQMSDHMTSAGVHTMRVKARMDSGTSAAKGLGNALDRVGKGATGAKTGLDRLLFKLGLFRFYVNVAQFAFKFFLDSLQVDKIVNFDQAMNFASTTLKGMGDTAENINPKLDAVVAAFGNRTDLLTKFLGDPAVLRDLQGMTPKLAKDLADLSLQAYTLENRDPAKFFDALAKVVLYGDTPGAIQELAELTGYGEKIFEIFKKEKAEGVVKFFQTAFAEDSRTGAINTKTAIAELESQWTQLITVLGKAVLPVVTVVLKELNSLFENIKGMFSPDSEQSQSLLVAAAVLGTLIGLALIGGGVSPIVGITGGLMGFQIINKVFEDFKDGDNGKALIAIAATLGFLIGAAIAGTVGTKTGIIGGLVSFVIIADGLNLLFSGDSFTKEGAAIKLAAEGIGAVIGFRIAGVAGATFGAAFGELIGRYLNPANILENIRPSSDTSFGDLFSKIKDALDKISPVGSFATGGVVPGPIGSPRLAMVHGGEVITNPNISNGNKGNTTIQLVLDKKILDEITIDSMGKFLRRRAGFLPGMM